ncbi:MAG: NYN domain-containing protein [bacterium]|nr:NYN domain-containing protein [bacterium]
MHYILDGNNIVKHRAWNKGNQKFNDMQAFIWFLEEYQRYHPSVRFTVVFDGWSDNLHSSSNLKILWSHDQTADDIIFKKISSLGKDAVLVSNDNEIRKSAKFAGLKILKVEEFLKIIEARKQKTQPVNAKEKVIPCKLVPEIRKELEKYYEKNPPETAGLRKIRKRFQRFF